jgi:hypothetical protein
LINEVLAEHIRKHVAQGAPRSGPPVFETGRSCGITAPWGHKRRAHSRRLGYPDRTLALATLASTILVTHD